MRRLPLHLLDEILFNLDPKSLGKMRCTNKSINSHISDDPNFKIEYFSRIGSSLLHVSKYDSNVLCFHPFGNSWSESEHLDNWLKILGSCSGLLLLSIKGRSCVANPLTNKFRFLDDSIWGKETWTRSGFAVDQIDRTTQRFKIVCITEQLEVSNPDETTYQFEINTGESWSLSKTTITCRSSKLKKGKNSKPVYLNGDLHWLRKDRSIVAFNPETEKARLIHSKFNRKPGKLLLCAGDNRLTLISATKKVISVFALENDGKWILVRRIKNKVVHQSIPLLYWNVHAYDGKCLLVRTMKNRRDGSVIHSYDVRANKWGVFRSLPRWCSPNRHFFLFKPSWSSVIGLLDQEEIKTKTDPLAVPESESISSVMAIMGLINRNLSFI
ncbi:F-box domain [Arabidopsis suecica]|uniref:F-box domain n=1 Tax=Arabidopsis suecica TaxID=45249 RepID=A0A8T2CEE8_ARASU|nr:F-box domain [Arabidopsis suecica]